MRPDEVWSKTLDELRLQMTQATFETWFTGAHVTNVDGRTWTIGVRNDFARHWLEKRLSETVRRTLAAVAGQEDIAIAYTVAQPPQVGPVYITATDKEPATFPGFESYQSNFVQVPRQFFEVVVPAGDPCVVKFVGTVVAQTIGVITNWHTGERREWWRASYSHIEDVTGLSAGSVVKAVRESRRHGYVVRQRRAQSFAYRLRRLGEPVDNPVDD